MNRVRRIIYAEELHRRGIRGKGITAAVMDSGICHHPDYSDRVVCFKDFVGYQTEAYDDASHGSHVTGILGGNGVMSMGRYCGIAPECDLVHLKVLDRNGNGKVSAASFNSTLLDFVTAFEGGIKDAGACLLTKDDQNIKTSGTAVFEKDKLSGFLNERETKGSLLLNKKVKNLEETVAIEGIGKVSYDIINSKSKAKVRIEDNKPIFDINICANISILEVAKEPNKELKEKDFDNINNKIEEQIRSLVSESINKTVFEYNSDIFNFTKLIKNNQTSYFKTIESNPKETLKKSSYNVNVKSKIKKIGQESDLV